MTWHNLECPIDDQEHDVTWHIVGRSIAREIKAVDLNLSEGEHVAKSGSLDCV